MSVSVSTTAGTQVTVTVDGATKLSFTTEESSISVVNGDTSSISVTNQGPKGDTGITGPQGPAGADGADGQGVPAGGDQFQLLRKISGTDYDTKWDYADRVTLEVRFDEAVSKGDPLYITGFNNGQNRVAVAKADASDSSKMPSIGLAFSDYSQNDNGQATAMGSLDDVNTQVSPNDFQEGDVLYVKAGGGLTNVKPTGTNLIQNVGKVGRRQQNNGEIVVMAIGRSNDVPNIPEGQFWIGNASGVATPTAFGIDLDSTPQLGGDLDVNGNNITSASNGDIVIDPNGTGAIILKSDDIQFDGGGTFSGKIKLYESDVLGSNFVALSAPLSVTSDITLTLPDGAGTNGQALKTNGGGTMSWGDVLDGVSETLTGVTSIKDGDLTRGQIAFYDDAGNNYVILKAPDVLASNTTFVLPEADGSAGQVLKTDGSGNLSFVNQTTDTDTNIGNSDQTLSATRTVEMGGNSLVFDNSSTEVAKIFPQGYVQATGRTIVNGNGSIGGLISLKDADSSNGVTLRCPTTVSSDLTLVLPDSDGSSGQVLKTDGSGNLSFGAGASRGGTYSYSGYSTDVTKTATFYYQFPSATATSSSTNMISGFVGQGISHGTYGSNGSLTLDGLSSTDSATYSITVKVTTNTTLIIGTLSPVAGQFTAANQIVTSSASEQTFTLTQTSPTSCLSQAGKQWVLGLQVTFFGAGSIDFRVEDLSITVS